MARKREAVPDFVLYDAFYEDGSQRSNRKVPGAVLVGPEDPTKAAKAFLEQQDLEIAAKSSVPARAIQSVKRSRK